MTEHVVTFGSEANLVGVLSVSNDYSARHNAPVVLMLNAGLLHRAGPHRMNVYLARALATHGICSLRFDLGGRGDSEAGRSGGTDEERVLADVTEAMDYLEQRGVGSRFVLLGLCAGADNAHLVALHDSRVVGAVLLDGLGYRTLRYYLEHYVPRFFRPRPWANFIRRHLSRPARDGGASGKVALEALEQPLRRPFGARDVAQQELERLVSRGVQLLYIYTGGVGDYYNYRGQFFDMFPRLKRSGRIDVEYFPFAEHTYPFAEDRERLVNRVIGWFESCQWVTSGDVAVG